MKAMSISDGGMNMIHSNYDSPMSHPRPQAVQPWPVDFEPIDNANKKTSPLSAHEEFVQTHDTIDHTLTTMEWLLVTAMVVFLLALSIYLCRKRIKNQINKMRAHRQCQVAPVTTEPVPQQNVALVSIPNIYELDYSSSNERDLPPPYSQCVSNCEGENLNKQSKQDQSASPTKVYGFNENKTKK